MELRTRQDAFDEACAQAIGEADLVYLSGGKPDHLLDVLEGTPAGAALWAVHWRGGIVAGCSAGAMVLAARQPRLRGRRFIRVPLGWRDALGLVEGAAVLPHYDALPEPLAAAVALVSSRGTVVLGIDEETAVIGRDGTWQVRGRGRVTVWRGRVGAPPTGTFRPTTRRGATAADAGGRTALCPPRCPCATAAARRRRRPATLACAARRARRPASGQPALTARKQSEQ